MKRLTLLTLTLLFVQPIVFAQTGTGPRWETRNADTGTRYLSGTETFRVGRDSANVVRPSGVYFAVRITRTKETFICDKLPYTLRWDTTRVPEGWHWLEVVLIDSTGSTPEKVVDSLKVYVRNNSTTPFPPPSSLVSGSGEEASGSTSTPTTPVVTDIRPTATGDGKVAPLPVLNGRRGTSRRFASRGRGREYRSLHMLSIPSVVIPEIVAATVADIDTSLSVPRVFCIR